MPQPPGSRSSRRTGKACDVEDAEEDEGDEAVTPVGGAAEERDPLSDHLVDDDKARIGAAGLTLDNGGGWDAQDGGDDDAEREGECERECGGMGGECECGPEKHGGDGTPGAGAGLP